MTLNARKCSRGSTFESTLSRKTWQSTTSWSACRTGKVAWRKNFGAHAFENTSFVFQSRRNLFIVSQDPDGPFEKR